MKLLSYIFFSGVIAISLQGCNLLSAAGISSQGQPTKKVDGTLVSTTANSSVNVDHNAWDKLLKTYVDEKGLVDYKGFKKDHKALKSYLNSVSALEPTNDWSVQELLAYYINLYNAYTVDAIVSNYPVGSIKDIGGVWTNGSVAIGKRQLSLGGIENGILRKMNEPRIHFAINCASISCPKLLNEAFTASKINEQLDKAAFGFINGDKNEISANNPKLSSIFEWYGKDYIVNGKSDVIAYINLFSNQKINKDASIKFKDYNWNLNEQ